MNGPAKCDKVNVYCCSKGVFVLYNLFNAMFQGEEIMEVLVVELRGATGGCYDRVSAAVP